MKKRLLVILIILTIVALGIKPSIEFFEKRQIKNHEAELALQLREQQAKAIKATKERNKAQIDETITKAKEALFKESNYAADAIQVKEAINQALEQKKREAEFANANIEAEASNALSNLSVEQAAFNAKEHTSATERRDMQLRIAEQTYAINKSKIRAEVQVISNFKKQAAVYNELAYRIDIYEKNLIALQELASAYIEFQQLAITDKSGKSETLQIGLILIDKSPETKKLYQSEIAFVIENRKKVNQLMAYSSSFKPLSLKEDDFIVYKDAIDANTDALNQANKNAESLKEELKATFKS